MPSFLKLRSSKTIPPVVDPSCCSNGWHAADSGAFTYMAEQPRNCCHHHPRQSAGALNSILHLGCGGGAEHPPPSIWCYSKSFWNDGPKLFNAQRPPRSLMLLFILIRNLEQELIILSQVKGWPATWPGSQTVSILFLGNRQYLIWYIVSLIPGLMPRHKSMSEMLLPCFYFPASPHTLFFQPTHLNDHLQTVL